LEVCQPEIFKNDRASQFTSREFTGRLENEAMRISMDRCGRAYDNIFIEHFWRSINSEEAYVYTYQTVSEASSSLDRYFLYYNTDRLYESLGYQIPHEIYVKE